MYNSESVLESGHIAQEQIGEIVSIALEVLKSLLMDTETPIDIRLRVALEIFELFGTTTRVSNVSNDDGVINSLEKNARDIEKNADKLSCIETLIKMAANNKNPAPVREEVRIIEH